MRCEGASDAAALPGLVSTTAARTLTGDPRRALLELLSEERTLLVLDNFETPWERDLAATESLLSEVASVPGVALVVSVRGAQRPIGVPWRPSIELGRLDPESAADLFLKVADRDWGERSSIRQGT